MYQDIIPYTLKKWCHLEWALSVKHALRRAWNDGWLSWIECELPKGTYAFCFDHDNNTLYVEKVEN